MQSDRSMIWGAVDGDTVIIALVESYLIMDIDHTDVVGCSGRWIAYECNLFPQFSSQIL